MKIVLDEQEMVTAVREYAEKRHLTEARYSSVGEITISFTSRRIDFFGKGRFETEISYDTQDPR